MKRLLAMTILTMGRMECAWSEGDLCDVATYQKYSVPPSQLTYVIESVVPGEHILEAYTIDTNNLISPTSEERRLLVTGPSIKTSWQRPTTRMDGSPLLPEEIAEYQIYDHYVQQQPCEAETVYGHLPQPQNEAVQAIGNQQLATVAGIIAAVQPAALEEGECLPGLPCPEGIEPEDMNSDDDAPPVGGEAPGAKKTEITLLDFFPPTMDSTCLDYCFKGICIWLHCSPAGCGVDTSVRVSHRNPDAVVSVYREPGENPWREIRILFGALQKEVLDASIDLWKIADNEEAGSADQISRSRQTRPLVYREADAFGYPYYMADLNDDLFCKTKSRPFQPIFQSAFDNYNWRIALGEYAYILNVLPGISTVGTPFVNAWGNVYRRSGFISQHDEPKANAVIAQRVGSIISADYQPHLYVSLAGEPANSGQKYFLLPPQLTNNSEAGGVWQMIAPVKDNQCLVFGQDSFMDKWSAGRESEDKASVFTLWRPYECCKEKRGSYLTTVPMEICL
jgi:integrating conjugative element protein (TIGR03756 family)